MNCDFKMLYLCIVIQKESLTRISQISRILFSSQATVTLTKPHRKNSARSKNP